MYSIVSSRRKAFWWHECDTLSSFIVLPSYLNRHSDSLQKIEWRNVERNVICQIMSITRYSIFFKTLSKLHAFEINFEIHQYLWLLRICIISAIRSQSNSCLGYATCDLVIFSAPSILTYFDVLQNINIWNHHGELIVNFTLKGVQ